MLSLMKRFLASTIALLASLSLAPSAFAQQLINCATIDPPFNILCFTENDIPTIIGAAIAFIFAIAVIIAIFFLLLGALKWIYSGGDKAAVEGARNTITAAVIGLVVLFFVFLVFTFILGFFGLGFDTITNIPAITPAP
jgi:hypothetical protein